MHIPGIPEHRWVPEESAGADRGAEEVGLHCGRDREGPGGLQGGQWRAAL